MITLHEVMAAAAAVGLLAAAGLFWCGMLWERSHWHEDGPEPAADEPDPAFWDTDPGPDPAGWVGELPPAAADPAETFPGWPTRARHAAPPLEGKLLPRAEARLLTTGDMALVAPLVMAGEFLRQLDAWEVQACAAASEYLR